MSVGQGAKSPNLGTRMPEVVESDKDDGLVTTHREAIEVAKPTPSNTGLKTKKSMFVKDSATVV